MVWYTLVVVGGWWSVVGAHLFTAAIAAAAATAAAVAECCPSSAADRWRDVVKRLAPESVRKVYGWEVGKRSLLKGEREDSQG